MPRLLRYIAIVCSSLAIQAGAVPLVSSDQGEVAFAPPPVSNLTADWRQGPIIEIYVRGFKDSNSDGYGDLQGVIDKLDYIKNLGFRGIWLMPVFASSDHNHGYAVKNLRQIEPEFGGEADLKRLIAEAHRRNIGLILDYIPNQTSSEHPIFEASLDKKSLYRDYFVWSEERPIGWKGFTGEPWHRLNGAWYYGVYDRAMPEWNWHNPAVMDFHLNNMRYWLNLGVDGFRLDAVGTLVENGPTEWTDQPQSKAAMHRLRKELSRYPGAKFQICEAPSDPVGYAADDACGSAFAFGLQRAIVRSATLGYTDRDMIDYLERQPVDRMGTFLSNHDSFAGPHLFNQVNGDLADYRLAAATQYLLPGIPFTFYGEEIGMSMASQAGSSDEQIWAPMPWTGENEISDAEGNPMFTFAGFTALKADNKRDQFRPLPDNWREFNVSSQEQNPNSLLHFYRKLITLRNASPALSTGAYRRIDAISAVNGKIAMPASPSGTVFTFLREHADERVLVAINYANREQSVRLSLKHPKMVYMEGASEARRIIKDKHGHAFVTLPSKSFVVYRLENSKRFR